MAAESVSGILDGGDAPEETASSSQMMKTLHSGNLSDEYVRADTFDLCNLDVAMDKRAVDKLLAAEKKRAETEQRRDDEPMEPWEIDLAKLEVEQLISPGTFGSVYRATYDGKVVLGM
jgi:hypothetical protein